MSSIEAVVAESSGFAAGVRRTSPTRRILARPPCAAVSKQRSSVSAARGPCVAARRTPPARVPRRARQARGSSLAPVAIATLARRLRNRLAMSAVDDLEHRSRGRLERPPLPSASSASCASGAKIARCLRKIDATLAPARSGSMAAAFTDRLAGRPLARFRRSPILVFHRSRRSETWRIGTGGFASRRAAVQQIPCRSVPLPIDYVRHTLRPAGGRERRASTSNCGE
jgi:hypothetical protein